MKKKPIDIRTLWQKSAKKSKVDLASTSTLQPVVTEREIGETNPNAPSIEPVTIESQIEATDRALAVTVEIEQPKAEPEIGSNDPDIEEEIEQRHSVPSTLSPIRDDDDSEAESSGEHIYDIELLSHDPGKRIQINEYNVNERNSVIRAFIALGPCQPRNHNFPIRTIGGKPQRFIASWFDEFKWLEYSVELDAAFCFVCYLFKHKTTSSGGDTFVKGGFRNWNMRARIMKHCGSMTSFHNVAQDRYNHLITPKATIVENFATTDEQDKARYMSRLTYSIKCVKFLLRQGLASRGHDESETSINKGNFLELLHMLAENFEEVAKVVLSNAPRNYKLTAPAIQRQIVNCYAKETTRLIIDELGGDYFAILADESSDVYQKEQLALCLRYVDKRGRVVERFLGVVHVESTTSLTLKAAIESLLMEHSLSLSMVHGQGYDGASNMRGHTNGLKKLIMDESPSAYYVHCFAHQLQLTLVAVAKDNPDCVWFFEQLKFLLNLLGNSCKKIQMLRVAQAQRIIEELDLGDIESGKGLNQEMGLGRPADTRWGSHYKTVMHVIPLYPSIRKVLLMVWKDRSQGAECTQAQTMLTTFQSFEFVFMAHLMPTILGFTADLNHALQKRDQDIVNAVELIVLTKLHLQQLREDLGWDDFLGEVKSFCVKHNIKEVDMYSFYRPVRRDRRFFIKIKNQHRFYVDMFLAVIDRYERHEIVYKLLKLVLLVPVATASVERMFSALNLVKNKSRNKIGDQYLNDCLVTVIEREFFCQVKESDIINRFIAMKDRRVKTSTFL